MSPYLSVYVPYYRRDAFLAIRYQVADLVIGIVARARLVVDVFRIVAIPYAVLYLLQPVAQAVIFIAQAVHAGVHRRGAVAQVFQNIAVGVVCDPFLVIHIHRYGRPCIGGLVQSPVYIHACETFMNIGDKIIALRKQKSISQTDLAKAVGVSREIIGRYERNDALPSIEVAAKIADVLEVSLDYLAGNSKKAAVDKKTMKLMHDIEDLEPSIKDKLIFLANAIIKDAKTGKAYAS